MKACEVTHRSIRNFFVGMSHCSRTAILLGRNGSQQLEKMIRWQYLATVKEISMVPDIWSKRTIILSATTASCLDCSKWNWKHDSAVRTETDHEHAKSWAQASGGSLYSWRKAWSILDLLENVVVADSYCIILWGKRATANGYSVIKEVEYSRTWSNRWLKGCGIVKQSLLKTASLKNLGVEIVKYAIFSNHIPTTYLSAQNFTLSLVGKPLNDHSTFARNFKERHVGSLH